MSRILDYLAKYDQTLTISQLKKFIEIEKMQLEEKETKEIDTIKQNFSNTHLKFIDEDSLFGKTLNVYLLKDYVRSERTTDWNLVYYFQGTKISFSKRNIHKEDFYPDRCGNSFSKEDLRQMTTITEDEFKKYSEYYNEISSKLNDLIRYEI